jgi:hypothetical protein
MTFGNLTERSDLRCLFAGMSGEEHARLLDRLLALDVRLGRLAEQATAHVGVPYRALGLALSSAGIQGGPSGDAGDIWFDVTPVRVGADRNAASSSWMVDSFIEVFCSDTPEPRGEAATHRLVHLEATVESPEAVVDALELHVSKMEQELFRHPRERYTATRHAELP